MNTRSLMLIGISLVFVGALTGLSYAATTGDWGVARDISDQERLSLREESALGDGLFFLALASRSHQGGGLHGGK